MWKCDYSINELLKISLISRATEKGQGRGHSGDWLTSVSCRDHRRDRMSANWNSYGRKFPVFVPGPAHYTLVWLQPHLQQGGHSKGTEYHLLPVRCSNPDKRSRSVSEVQAWPQPHQGLPEVSIANFLIHFYRSFHRLPWGLRTAFFAHQKSTGSHFLSVTYRFSAQPRGTRDKGRLWGLDTIWPNFKKERKLSVLEIQGNLTWSSA